MGNSTELERPSIQHLEIPENDVDEDQETTPMISQSMIEQDQPSHLLGSEEPNTERKSRKRQRHPGEWQQNIRKKRRDNGKEYISRAGKRVAARKRKVHKCGDCKYRCNEKVNEESREKMFHDYWKLADHKRQRDYISYHVKGKPVIKGIPGSRKSKILSYFLTVNQEQVQVCKQTFLSTLGIGEKTVYHTVNHRGENGIPVDDRRGGRNPMHATPTEVLNGIREHINSFPVIESHYCRSSTQKKYLEQSLNLSKMYELYVQNCHETGRTAAKICTYRKVFNEEFNIGFHKPKKDLCNTCYTYDNSSEERKEELNDSYTEHQRRKEQARLKKEADKQDARNDESTKVCTFDLQAVLQTPKSNISSIYYKRKLNSYNFTIFDLVSKDCMCYMWHEAIGKRGSNEMASCLAHYLTQQTQTKIKLYSDACGGQNRNHNMTAMLHHVVKTTAIERIEHSYMETGHSQMEVDSVHSTIERAARNVAVSSPSQYETIIQLARKDNPYRVQRVDSPFFRDYSGTNSLKKSVTGETIKWMKVKRFIYTKDHIHFSYEYVGDMFEISLETPRRSTRGMQGRDIPQLYVSPPEISEAKYKDLLSLCKSGLIDKTYHSFYTDLPHTTQDDTED